MSNEEMFLTILNRMDSMETGFNGLNARMDQLETGLNGRMDKLEADLNGRMDKLESDMNMEFHAVRTEMDVLNKSLNKKIDVLSSKVDRLMITKDVEGYDQINIRLNVLERGYQELKEKIV